jgi:small subunit ribosomal protein S21
VATIYLRQGEHIEEALKRFKRIVEDEGILQEVKRRARYMTPSETRRVKSIERKKMIAKMKRKEEKMNYRNK